MEIIKGGANGLPMYRFGSADDAELSAQRCSEIGHTECDENDLIGLGITVYEGRKLTPKETMIMMPIYEVKDLIIALQNLVYNTSTAVGK